MQSLFVMQNAAAALEEIAAVDASIDLGDRDAIDAWGIVALSALAYQKSLRVSLDGAGARRPSHVASDSTKCCAIKTQPLEPSRGQSSSARSTALIRSMLSRGRSLV